VGLGIHPHCHPTPPYCRRSPPPSQTMDMGQGFRTTARDQLWWRKTASAHCRGASFMISTTVPIDFAKKMLSWYPRVGAFSNLSWLAHLHRFANHRLTVLEVYLKFSIHPMTAH
jgi:hypothetical protein